MPDRLTTDAGEPPHRTEYVLCEHTYSGMVTGATHYYGSIEVDGTQVVEVQLVLDTDEARCLTRQSRRYDPDAPPYEAGDVTIRFTDRQALRDAALAWFHEHARTGDVLLTRMAWLTGSDAVLARK